MSTKEEFILELSKLRSGSTFLNLHAYKNANNEIAHFNIVFHISYLNALKRSVTVLEALVPDSPLQVQAKHELLTSYHTSIAKGETTPVEEIDDAYTRFYDSDGSHIKGVKMHTETGNLHIYGLAHQKVVIEPGTYKKVNSKPLTIEKQKLSRLCPVSKFRQFRINPNQVEKISVQKISLLPPRIDMPCTKCNDTKEIIVSATPWGNTTVVCTVCQTICWECEERPPADGFSVCKECWNKAHPDLAI